MARSIDVIIRQFGKLLIQNEMKLAVAESCTGGLIAAKIVDLPGSSEFFQGGIVAYSNEIKVNLLAVKNETIIRYGAVSSPCAREMAKSVCDKFAADCGIAVTGIAGPGGATNEKPVGLVYFGIALKDFSYVEKQFFKGDRTEIRKKAVAHSLKLFYEILKNRYLNERS